GNDGEEFIQITECDAMRAVFLDEEFVGIYAEHKVIFEDFEFLGGSIRHFHDGVFFDPFDKRKSLLDIFYFILIYIRRPNHGTPQIKSIVSGAPEGIEPRFKIS